MMGAMLGGAFMGFAGMMSFIGSFLMMLLGPLFGAMGQMFSLMTPQ